MSVLSSKPNCLNLYITVIASAFNGNYLPWAVGIIVDGEAYTVMSTPGQACMDGPPAKQLSMTVCYRKYYFPPAIYLNAASLFRHSSRQARLSSLWKLVL